MRVLTSKADAKAMLEELEAKDKTRDSTGILMHYQQGAAIETQEMGPSCKAAVAEIERLTGLKAKSVMANRILEGGRSGWHVDPGFVRQRYHLPLKTSEGSYYEDGDNGVVVMTLGSWHGPVEYWLPHAVWNYGPGERVHFIVDLE